MKELFIETLKRAKKKYSFVIENFCIMGDHIHLIIRPERGASLSAIMQWVLSVFAMAYNRIMGLHGHVWGARFFSRIINSFEAFRHVMIYIDQNPVQAGMARAANSWRYGGAWQARAGRRELLGVSPPWVLILFPDRLPALLPG